MKIMYVNYGFRIEYESDLRTNEHYLGSCESKARKNKKKTKQNKTKQNKTKATTTTTTTTTTKKTGFEPVTEVTRNCVHHLS